MLGSSLARCLGVEGRRDCSALALGHPLQVLHELRSKTTLGYLTQGVRNSWPLRKLLGDEPNFEYNDPTRPGEKAHALLRVQPAREPSDYMWTNL